MALRNAFLTMTKVRSWDMYAQQEHLLKIFEGLDAQLQPSWSERMFRYRKNVTGLYIHGDTGM